MRKVLFTCMLMLCPIVVWAQGTGYRVVDLAFDDYVNPALLRVVALTNDPDALTDIALQLAKGEAELLRSHHAISVDDTLRNAWRLAVMKGNVPAQERIKGVLDKLGKKELLAKFEAENRLAGASRTAVPKFSVKKNSVEDAFVRNLLHSVNNITMTQDRDAIDSLIKSVNHENCRLADNVKKELTTYLGDVKKTIPETADPSVASLRNLLGTSRFLIIPGQDDDKLNAVSRSRPPLPPGGPTSGPTFPDPWGDQLGGWSRVAISDAPLTTVDTQKLDGQSRTLPLFLDPTIYPLDETLIYYPETGKLMAPSRAVGWSKLDGPSREGSDSGDSTDDSMIPPAMIGGSY